MTHVQGMFQSCCHVPDCTQTPPARLLLTVVWTHTCAAPEHAPSMAGAPHLLRSYIFLTFHPFHLSSTSFPPGLLRSYTVAIVGNGRDPQYTESILLLGAWPDESSGMSAMLSQMCEVCRAMHSHAIACPGYSVSQTQPPKTHDRLRSLRCMHVIYAHAHTGRLRDICTFIW